MMFDKTMVPSEILYYFNEPQLFVTKQGSRSLLVIKVAEHDNANEYLAVPTSENDIAKLKGGTISLRSAFFQPWCWLVKMDDEFGIRDSREVSANEVPPRYFPTAGVGLYPHHGRISDQTVTDTVTQPFMTFKFEGKNLSEGTISFSTFVTLISETYSSLHKVFSSAVGSIGSFSEVQLNRMLQIPMRETKLASLSIEIEHPLIRPPSRRAKQRFVAIDREAAHEGLTAASQSFIDAVQKIDSLARLNDLEQYFSYNPTTALAALAQLAPPESAAYEILKIGGTASNGQFTTITVDAKSGKRIRDVYKQAVRSGDQKIGNVVEINKPSNTFILEDFIGRKTTCVVSAPNFDFDINSLAGQRNIRVFGQFEKRKMRDKLYLEKIESEYGIVWSK